MNQTTGTGRVAQLARLFLASALPLASMQKSQGAPPSAVPIQMGMSLPSDFVPQSQDFDDPNANGQYLGIAGLRGRQLKPRDGFEMVYVMSVPQGRFDGEPFMAGDLIVSPKGVPIRGGALASFKRSADGMQPAGGKLTFIRWRKGVTENVTIQFDGPQIPDLTQGAEPDVAQISWNLGTTGAAGWTWSIPHQTTEGAAQIYITRVAKGSPADSMLKAGDVILGEAGHAFTHNARDEFAVALAEAETPEKGGKLVLTVWNGGQIREATVKVKVMGRYSNTTPFACTKSTRIVDEACQYLKGHGISDGLVRADVDSLGLLATGRKDLLPLVQERVKKNVAESKDLQIKGSVDTWIWAYHNLLLTEYYLATKDKSVLPAIRAYSTGIAKGQSAFGSWGYSLCVPYRFSDGPVEGVCPGYGALNQAGLPSLLSLILATKCGVTDDPVPKAIARGRSFFMFYMERGTIPYGDHTPEFDAHDDNGRNSLAAIVFDLLGDKEAAMYYTKMSVASWREREPGHTGNYFSFLWGPLGARGGGPAASAFMKKINWFFDLERRSDGNFIYQGKPGMGDNNNPENRYQGWDCTGARLLAYCLPLKQLYITSKDGSSISLKDAELKDALEAGQLLPKQYKSLTTDTLLAKLGRWSPIVRYRAAMALAEKPDDVVPQLIAMLDDNNRYARYGACEGLRYAGRASTAAADAIIAKGLGSKDPTMRFYAMRAFSSTDAKMGLSAVASRALPAMLQMAATSHPDDPDARLAGELTNYLFYNRGEWVKQADNGLMVKAVRELLKNKGGSNRGRVAVIYDKLSDEQLKLLWKDIDHAIRELAPADVMFSIGVRLAGIQLMAKHHTREGLDRAVWYLTNQKGPAADRASTREFGDGTDRMLKIIVEQYAGYAKEKIPEIEKAADYLAETHQSKEMADKVRAAIKSIETAPKPAWEMCSIAEYLK